MPEERKPLNACILCTLTEGGPNQTVLETPGTQEHVISALKYAIAGSFLFWLCSHDAFLLLIDFGTL